MTREQLEHIIKACAAITNQYDFIIVGSQSILGHDPNPPNEFTASMKADALHANCQGFLDSCRCVQFAKSWVRRSKQSKPSGALPRTRYAGPLERSATS